MFLLPITIICFCYTRIAFKVKRSGKAFRRGVGERHRGGTINAGVSVLKISIRKSLSFFFHFFQNSVSSTSNTAQISRRMFQKIVSEKPPAEVPASANNLNTVIILLVIGVVVCWVPFHIFQLLISVSSLSEVFLAILQWVSKSSNKPFESRPNFSDFQN